MDKSTGVGARDEWFTLGFLNLLANPTISQRYLHYADYASEISVSISFGFTPTILRIF